MNPLFEQIEQKILKYSFQNSILYSHLLPVSSICSKKTCYIQILHSKVMSDVHEYLQNKSKKHLNSTIGLPPPIKV